MPGLLRQSWLLLVIQGVAALTILITAGLRLRQLLPGADRLRGSFPISR